MANQPAQPKIYQSGQVVVVSGLYEVVGAGYVYYNDEKATSEFHGGAIFPDFQGRAVCWHLVRALEVMPEAKPNQTQQG
jgi:hypothetical protein